MWCLRALVVLVTAVPAAWLGVTPARAQEGAVDLSTLSPDLKAIAIATELSFGALGRSDQVSEAFAAYSRLAWSPSDAAQLAWIAEQGTPAGRLYAALLLWHQDEAAGRSTLEGMLGETEALTEIVGCIVEDSTVGARAAEYLVSGPLDRPVQIATEAQPR